MFLLSVAAIWTVAALTPGANFLVVVRCALTGSRPVIIAAILGTIAGTACWGLAGWLGIGLLFKAAPAAYLVLKIAGGLYLVFLGLRQLWQARRGGQHGLALAGEAGITPGKAWRLGMVTNLANPKSAVFVSSLFAATLPPEAPWSHGVAAVAIMVTISGLWYSLVSLALTRPRVLAGYQRARRAIDAASGMVFIGFGARLMLADR